MNVPKAIVIRIVKKSVSLTNDSILFKATKVEIDAAKKNKEKYFKKIFELISFIISTLGDLTRKISKKTTFIILNENH
jgi:hypothetical protein